MKQTLRQFIEQRRSPGLRGDARPQQQDAPAGVRTPRPEYRRTPIHRRGAGVRQRLAAGVVGVGEHDRRRPQPHHAVGVGDRCDRPAAVAIADRAFLGPDRAADRRPDQFRPAFLRRRIRLSAGPLQPRRRGRGDGARLRQRARLDQAPADRDRATWARRGRSSKANCPSPATSSWRCCRPGACSTACGTQLDTFAAAGTGEGGGRRFLHLLRSATAKPVVRDRRRVGQGHPGGVVHGAQRDHAGSGGARWAARRRPRCSKRPSAWPRATRPACSRPCCAASSRTHRHAVRWPAPATSRRCCCMPTAARELLPVQPGPPLGFEVGRAATRLARPAARRATPCWPTPTASPRPSTVDNEAFGSERLLRGPATRADSAKEQCQRAGGRRCMRFAGAAPQSDDITVLAIRFSREARAREERLTC